MLTDWLNAWGTLRVLVCFLLARVRACILSPSLFLSLFRSFSLSLSLWLVKRMCVGVLYACKGAHNLFTGHIERGKREKEGECVWERERERDRERVIFILKGMTGALAPFSYLVYDNDLDQLSKFASTPNSLLHFQLKILHFLSLLIRLSVSQTQAFKRDILINFLNTFHFNYHGK